MLNYGSSSYPIAIRKLQIPISCYVNFGFVCGCFFVVLCASSPLAAGVSLSDTRSINSEGCVTGNGSIAYVRRKQWSHLDVARFDFMISYSGRYGNVSLDLQGGRAPDDQKMNVSQYFWARQRSLFALILDVCLGRA